MGWPLQRDVGSRKTISKLGDPRIYSRAPGNDPAVSGELPISEVVDNHQVFDRWEGRGPAQDRELLLGVWGGKAKGWGTECTCRLLRGQAKEEMALHLMPGWGKATSREGSCADIWDRGQSVALAIQTAKGVGGLGAGWSHPGPRCADHKPQCGQEWSSFWQRRFGEHLCLSSHLSTVHCFPRSGSLKWLWIKAYEHSADLRQVREVPCQVASQTQLL